MSLKMLFTSVLISSTLLLSACSSTSEADDAPNATSQITMDIKEVASDSPDKPAFSASISMVMTSTVIKIDQKTRLVTLKDEQGEPVSFTAGEEVRNLAQVNVGDTVLAEYMQNITIQVLATKNPETAAAEIATMGRAAEGEMPGVGMIGFTVVVLTVEEINLKNNTFKLKNEDDVIQEFTAQNPENLKKVAEGDVVVLSYTEGFAISVEKKASE
jgi:hypothetical protein